MTGEKTVRGMTRFQYGLGQAKKYKQLYWMLLPYMLFFCAFTIVPVFVSIFFSFTQFNVLQPPIFIGLDNYVRLFLDDPIFLKAVKNTLILAVITGPFGRDGGTGAPGLVALQPCIIKQAATMLIPRTSPSFCAFIFFILIFWIPPRRAAPPHRRRRRTRRRGPRNFEIDRNSPCPARGAPPRLRTHRAGTSRPPGRASRRPRTGRFPATHRRAGLRNAL